MKSLLFRALPGPKRDPYTKQWCSLYTNKYTQYTPFSALGAAESNQSSEGRGEKGWSLPHSPTLGPLRLGDPGQFPPPKQNKKRLVPGE